MKKYFIKNLSNKYPTKDIQRMILNSLPLSTSKKVKYKVNIGNNIIFRLKNIPVIVGPNGVESHKLMIKC